MEAPYSLILFSAKHPANIFHFLPITSCDICGKKIKAQQCCATPSIHGDFFMCRACCYNHRREFAEESFMDLDQAAPPPRRGVEPELEDWDEERITPQMELSYYLYFLSLTDKIGGSEVFPPGSQ